MQHSTLSSFIAHARSKGMDHQTIRMLLLSAGWKEKDVSQALASEALDMEVPVPTDGGSARDAFFHLLAFTTLISTITSLIVLFFDQLNTLFPDAAFPYSDYGSDFSGNRWAIAVVLVSFPLFLFLTRAVNNECKAHPEKLASGVRRWLTYLTLFLTACTLVGDLTTLVFYMLDGELTVRFLAKVLVLFVLAGLPFLYYFHTLRLSAEGFRKTWFHKIFFYVSILIVLKALFWGFFMTGSPFYGRMQRFDEQRVNDLRSLQGQIITITYGEAQWKEPAPTSLPNPLPKTLKEVALAATYQKLNITDPETQEPYTYRVISPTKYELCATFSLARDQEYDIFWNHSTGEKCYEFNALDRTTK